MNVQYIIDAPNGIVYGLRGMPVGRPHGTGYLRVSNRKYCAYAHRLIWESVYGPIPEWLEINHINGVKTDNRIANLELVTRSENIRHAYRTGLRSSVGEANARAKLSEIDVLSIRKRRSNGEKLKSIAESFGVVSETVRLIVNKRNWRHIA